MKNIEIAQIFNNIANMLEIENENPFRIRAYRRAAENLENIAEDIEELVAKGELEGLPGIGKDLASKIEEFIKTGKIKFYEDLKKHAPLVVLDLMGIPGIGPKTAKLLATKLRLKSIKGLEKKLKNLNQLKKLPGIKEKTLSNILRGIEFVKKSKGKTSLGIAFPIANNIISRLKKLSEVKKIEAAGSLRRMKETVRDIDILATSTKPQKIMDIFVKLPQVKSILAHGLTKSSIITKGNIQVDVRVVNPSSFGAAMAYFTGSKSHNIKLREIAMKKGWKLNEYGLFHGKTNKKIAGKEEMDVYKALGLTFIPPQLREDMGEIESSLKKKLPKLISLSDIKGDLHVHSNYSDGSVPIEDMAEEAIKRGYQYIAITDHSKSLKIAGGLSEKNLLKQIKLIRKLNKKFKKFKIFTGSEVDILSDGKLDFGNDILKELDFVIAAVHSGFKQSKDTLTSRIIRAMENKYVKSIAHPTGRIIGAREAYQIDLEKILKTAKDTKTALEINAYPLRLDLNDLACRQAKEMGLSLVINTDAHIIEQLDMMIYGVSVAQRAWFTKKDILNTLPLQDFIKRIHK